MSQSMPRPNRPGPPGSGEEGRINLWRLPRLVSIAVRHVTYPQPKVYYVGTERKETRQAVELRVQTDAPLPIRAVTPILKIGNTVIADYNTEGATRYRFVAYEPERLEPGAVIRWGWPNSAEGLIATPFRLSLELSPPLVAAANARRPRGAGLREDVTETALREDITEQAPQPRFRTVFYDRESLRFLDGWTRARGPSAVCLIDRSTYDTIRADGTRRGREFDRYLAQTLAGRRDLMPPLFVLDETLATVPLDQASRGNWDDLMISQLINAGRQLRIQSESDQWAVINRLFANAQADARDAAQRQRAAREFVAYFVLDAINATLSMVEATNVTMQNGHAVIPLGNVRGTDRFVVPGGDAAARVIGDIHTHYLLDPLIDLNRSSVGTTIRFSQTSLHSGVSDVDVDAARTHLVVYAIDSKYLHRANPDGTKNDKLPRSGDVLREALRIFGGEPGPRNHG